MRVGVSGRGFAGESVEDVSGAVAEGPSLLNYKTPMMGGHPALT